MNDAFLQKMQLLQQNQMQSQGAHGQMPAPQEYPMQHYDPISKGAQDAMQSVRQSLSMDPSQSRRALGVALMNLAGNMGVPHPGSGFSGALGSLNQGMMPAVQSYLSEEDKYRNLNSAILNRQDKLQQQRMEQHYRQQQLARELAHDESQERLLRDRLNHDIRKEKKEEVVSEDGIFPLSSLTPSIRKGYEDELRADEKQGEESYKVMNIGDKMLAEIQKHPDLSEDFSRTMLPKNERKLSLSDYARMKLMPKEKRAALERFSKLSNSLVLHQIKGSSGKAMTDLMKGFLTEVVPNAGMTDEAKKYMIKTYKEEFMPIYERGVVANKARRKRVYIPKDIKHYGQQEEAEIENDMPVEAGVASGTPVSSPSQLSNAQLKALGNARGIK